MNSYELMTKRLNAIIPDETWEALEKVASREMRTKSQMTAILLGEALAEYWRRNPPTPEQSEAEPTESRPASATKAKRGKSADKGG
jgi:hypothetical protein